MSGMSMITAIEIFTNANDLEFTIGQEEGGGKFAVGIFRGPGHNYKPLVTSGAFANTLEEAVKFIENLLESIFKPGDEESLFSKLLKLGDAEIDQSKFLNQDLVTRILSELRKNRRANTAEMLAVAG